MPRLGVSDGCGNFKLLVRTLHTSAYQPCKNESLTLTADPYLTLKLGWNIEKILKFTRQIALFKGDAFFNDFSQSIVATGVESFRILSYMIEPSAHLIRRYGRKRVILDGTSNLKYISNFKSFWPAWVTRLGVTDGFGNFKLLVRTLHTCAYQPCKNESLTLTADPYLTVKFGWNIEKILKFTGQIALFKEGAYFNDFWQSIIATGVEAFRIYSYMIEPSAHLVRRYGRMRVIQDGTSNLKFI